MKKVLAVLLAVCMIASLGVTAFADAKDYPWGSLEVKTVIIADGVKAVPADAFEGMTDIETVVLPASVKEVDADAFADAAIATVLTAGDPADLENVKAFENAEIVVLEDAAFEEMLAEVEAQVGDDFAFDAETGTLLVMNFNKKAVAKVFGPYVDYGAPAAASSSSDSGSKTPSPAEGEVDTPAAETETPAGE